MPTRGRSSYLRFQEIATEANRKTLAWAVIGISTGTRLGEIRYYSIWRCYTFQPTAYTSWNADCLTEVSAFLAAHRGDRKPRPGSQDG